MQVKKQQLEPDMKQQTGSKLGKEYVKGVFCHSAYLTYMQNTSYEMPGWTKHKLESRLPGGKYQQPQICRLHGAMETVTDFIFSGSKNHCRG